MREDWLAFCREIASDVEAMLRRYPTRDDREPVVGQGRGGDDTTVIDAGAEEVAVAHLEALETRGVGFLLVSEELGERRFGDPASPWIVVLDPIDGSLNAKRGLPFYCISIAFANGPTLNDVQFGFVKDFGSGEEWVAEKGSGATVNGRALGGVRPKNRLGIVDLEATTAALVADAATRLDGHVGRIRLLGALAPRPLPARRRPGGRRRHAQALALGGSGRGRADRAGGGRDARHGRLGRTQAEPREPLAHRRRARSRVGRDAARSHLRREPSISTLRGVIAQDEIREALTGVIDPEIRRSVVELDMVRGVDVTGAHVDVTIALTVAGCPMKADLEGQVRSKVGAVAGVESVGVTFDVMTPAERTALRTRLQGAGGEAPAAGAKKPITIPPTASVIAVASGKGGVGKSSLTANFAASLAATGAEVGVIDADIYGYSIPRMLGISRRPVVVDGMIVPPVAHGIKIMSIGFFIDEDGAVLWRGPMLHRALEQFLTDVLLGRDRPPHGGHAARHRRRCHLAGAAPALAAARARDDAPGGRAGGGQARGRGRRQDRHAAAGVIENMSYALCACCGERSHPFGQGGGAQLAGASAPICSARCRSTSGCASAATTAAAGAGGARVAGGGRDRGHRRGALHPTGAQDARRRADQAPAVRALGAG